MVHVFKAKNKQHFQGGKVSGAFHDILEWNLYWSSSESLEVNLLEYWKRALTGLFYSVANL